MMMTEAAAQPSIDEMGQQVRRLQRRSSAALCVGLGALAAALAVSGFVAWRQELTLRRLVIVDENGTQRLLMEARGCCETGGVKLFDRFGRLRAFLHTQGENGRPKLTLFDHKTEPRAVWGLDDNGEPDLHVWDGMRRERVVTAGKETAKPPASAPARARAGPP